MKKSALIVTIILLIVALVIPAGIALAASGNAPMFGYPETGGPSSSTQSGSALVSPFALFGADCVVNLHYTNGIAHIGFRGCFGVVTVQLPGSGDDCSIVHEGVPLTTWDNGSGLLYSYVSVIDDSADGDYWVVCE